MSDFVRVFGISLPSSPGMMTPETYDTELGLCVVNQIQVIFPPGCAGLVGVAIAPGGQQFYPPSGDPLVTFDDNVWNIDVANQINSGSWAVLAYNADQFTHVIQVIYYCDNVQYSPSASVSTAVAI